MNSSSPAFGVAVQALFEPPTVAKMTQEEFWEFWKFLGGAVRIAAIARARPDVDKSSPSGSPVEEALEKLAPAKAGR